MRLVILAAGVARRLPDLDYPKALIEFDGLTITEMVIRDFAEYGVTDVAICVGHQQDKIYRAMEDCGRNIKIAFYPDDEIIGAANSLLYARDFFAGHSCVIMEGDHLVHPTLIQRLMQDERKNLVLADNSVAPEFDEETVLKVKDIGIVDKLIWPASNIEKGECKFVVGEALTIFKMCPGATNLLAKNLGPGEIIEPINRVYEDLGCEWGYMPTHGLPWIEIDTPADLERAGEIYKQIEKGATNG